MSATAGTEKPCALVPIFENIPVELVRIHAWMGWAYDRADRDRWTKKPRRVDGALASSTDPATWAPLEDVQAVYELGTRGWDGIGFALDAVSDYVGVDLDHVIAEDGTIHPDALQLVRDLNTYTERSPGGHGLRLMARGALPAGWRNQRSALPFPVEVYAEGRYLTITGHHLEGTPRAIEERTPELAALHARVAALVGASNGHATDRAADNWRRRRTARSSRRSVRAIPPRMAVTIPALTWPSARASPSGRGAMPAESTGCSDEAA